MNKFINCAMNERVREEREKKERKTKCNNRITIM